MTSGAAPNKTWCTMTARAQGASFGERRPRSGASRVCLGAARSAKKRVSQASGVGRGREVAVPIPCATRTLSSAGQMRPNLGPNPARVPLISRLSLAKRWALSAAKVGRNPGPNSGQPRRHSADGADFGKTAPPHRPKTANLLPTLETDFPSGRISSRAGVVWTSVQTRARAHARGTKLDERCCVWRGADRLLVWKTTGATDAT